GTARSAEGTLRVQPHSAARQDSSAHKDVAAEDAVREASAARQDLDRPSVAPGRVRRSPARLAAVRLEGGIGIEVNRARGMPAEQLDESPAASVVVVRSVAVGTPVGLEQAPDRERASSGTALGPDDSAIRGTAGQLAG